MPWTHVAPAVVPTIIGSRSKRCWYMTSLIRYRKATGTARPQRRFTIMRPKQPVRSHRSGLMRFHTSGDVAANLGFHCRLIAKAWAPLDRRSDLSSELLRLDTFEEEFIVSRSGRAIGQMCQ